MKLTDSSSSSGRMRPAERVRQYIDDRLAQHNPAQETRLPTARELAEILKVSPRTVLTVYRQYVARQLLRTQAGGGTYISKSTSRPAIREPIRIGLSGLPATHDIRLAWGGLICAGVIDAAAASQPPCSVIPLLTSDANATAFAGIQTMIDRLDDVDGLVLFPAHLRYPELIDACQRAGKPVVFVNPPSDMATMNFASPDFYGASLHIAQSLLQAGRRSLALLLAGSSQPPEPGQRWSVRLGVSSQHRINGMMAGIGPRLGVDVSFHVLVAPSTHEADAARTIDAFLDKGNTFDALYTSGDFLAAGAIDALLRRGLRVPEDVSVIGGTGTDMSQTPYPMLTRIAQPLRETGQALAAMLRQLITQPGSSCPGMYLPTPIIGGATTRPIENQLLQVGQPARIDNPLSP